MAIQHIGQAQQSSPHSLLKLKHMLEQGMNAFGQFLFDYWPHILTTILGLIVTAAVAVPILSYFGLDSIAKPLFYSMHFICAQIPAHSFYIFGHQLGLCARNLSIYASMFVGSSIFTLSKKRLPGLPWWAWAILIMPMAWDGITQMFGLRESSWELRVLTGTLFGLANVMFVLPMIQKALLETPLYTLPTQYVQVPATYPTLPPFPQQTAMVTSVADANTPSEVENTPQNVTSFVPMKEGHKTQEEIATETGD
jgi:uncharacterized membrane protein